MSVVKKGSMKCELSKKERHFNSSRHQRLSLTVLELSCAGISHANEWLTACTEALESFKESAWCGNCGAVDD